MPLTISHTTPITPVKKIGRNDPCLCGSGKKYKKCCQSKKNIYSPNEKSQNLTRVYSCFDKFPWYSKLVKQHIDTVLSNKKEVLKTELDWLTEGVIFEETYRGRTLLHNFINFGEFSAQDKETYRSWVTKSIFSFFIIEKVHIGSMLEIRDIVDGKKYSVYEILATYSAQPDQIIITRIIPYKDNWTLTGGGLNAYPKEAFDSVMASANKHKTHLSQLDYLYIMHTGKSHSDKIKNPDYINISDTELRELLIDLLDIYGVKLDVAAIEAYIKGNKNPDMQALIEQITKYNLANPVMIRMSNVFMEFCIRLLDKDNIIDYGPIERKLVAELMEYIWEQIPKYNHLTKRQLDEKMKILQDRWLNIKKDGLGGKSPAEVILSERKKRGNPQQKIQYRYRIKEY